MDSIDDTFSTLGDNAKKAIYYHLEHKFKLRREEIPVNVDAFSNAIELVFGLGAKNLKILIMKRLHEKLGYQHDLGKMPSENLSFVEYVLLTKKSYLDLT